MILLKRVSYGKSSTPKEDREYRINGAGPVGSLSEYNKTFPNKRFLIEDKINYEDNDRVY